MKKTYFAPNTTIVVLNSKQTLLTGSSAVSGLDGFGGGTISDTVSGNTFGRGVHALGFRIDIAGRKIVFRHSVHRDYRSCVSREFSVSPRAVGGLSNY